MIQLVNFISAQRHWEAPYHTSFSSSLPKIVQCTIVVLQSYQSDKKGAELLKKGIICGHCYKFSNNRVSAVFYCLLHNCSHHENF